MTRYAAILTVLVTSQCIAQAPQPPQADIVAFERTPEEGLRGVLRYRLEIQRRRQELARLQQQRQDLATHLVARGMARPEALDLATERDAAKASLKLASDAALMPLKTQAEYRAARDARDATRARLEAIREFGPDTDLAAAASAMAEASGRVNRMETEAVAGNPEVLAARKRITAVEAAYTRMQNEAVATARDDQQYKELSQAIEDTLADLNAAAADLAQANGGTRGGEFIGWEEMGRWETPGNAGPASRFKRPGSHFDPNLDYSNGTWRYLGMRPVTLQGQVYMPDPHQPIIPPFPYGQAPPRP